MDDDYKNKIRALNKSIEKQQEMMKQIAKISRPVINLNVNNPLSDQVENMQKQLRKCYEPVRQCQKIINHSYPDFSNLTGMATFASELAKFQITYTNQELKNIQECLRRVAKISNSVTNLTLSDDLDRIIDNYSRLLNVSNKIYKSYSSKINQEINADYLIKSIDSIDELNDEESSLVASYLEQNKDSVNEIITAQNNNSLDENVKTSLTKKNIDWKFIIGNIIVPLLIAFATNCLQKNEPTIEINNYYGDSTKTEVNNGQDLSHENIQKMIKLLEEIDKQNEESNRMKDRANP